MLFVLYIVLNNRDLKKIKTTKHFKVRMILVL